MFWQFNLLLDNDYFAKRAMSGNYGEIVLSNGFHLRL